MSTTVDGTSLDTISSFSQLRSHLHAALEKLGEAILSIDASSFPDIKAHQEKYREAQRVLRDSTHARQQSVEATAGITAARERLQNCSEQEKNAVDALKQAARPFLAAACDAVTQGVLASVEAALSTAHQELCALRREYETVSQQDTKGMWGAAVAAGKKVVLAGRILVQEQTWFSACDEWVARFIEDSSVAEAMRCDDTETPFRALHELHREVSDSKKAKVVAEAALAELETRASLLKVLTEEEEASSKHACESRDALIAGYHVERDFRRAEINAQTEACLQAVEQLKKKEAALVLLYGVVPEPIDIETHSPLTDRQNQLLKGLIDPDEVILWQLCSSDALICTTKKVVILTDIFLKVNTFVASLRDIVSVQIKTQIGLGYVQVITAGMSSSDVDPWDKKRRDHPNIWGFGTRTPQAAQAREVVRCILAKAQQSRELAETSRSQSTSVADELGKLSALKEKGVLNDDEFQREKERLLSSRK